MKDHVPNPLAELRGAQWTLLICVLLLCAVGILFIASASSRYIDQGDWTYGDKPGKQAVWLGLGLVVFFVMLLFKYTRLMRLSYLLYLLGLGCLVGLLIFAKEVNHSRSWFFVGPMRIQPSEFMKIALILCLARYLMYRKNYRRFSGLVGPFVLTLAPMLLIIDQPDLGTAMVFLPVLFALLYVAGAKLKHLFTIMGMGLASLPLVYTFLLSEKHQERVVAFLHPEQHLAGPGFQIVNALYAIGSGGFLGKGWHQGTQNLLGFIPYDDNDFIFAVYAEEWGLLGALLLLAVFFLIIILGIGIAGRTREPFGRLVAVGVVVLFAVQVLINVGVTVALMPVTGLTLPFISYGGSSLLTCFIALGLLINVGMHKEPVLADEDFD